MTHLRLKPMLYVSTTTKEMVTKRLKCACFYVQHFCFSLLCCRHHFYLILWFANNLFENLKSTCSVETTELFSSSVFKNIISFINRKQANNFNLIKFTVQFFFNLKSVLLYRKQPDRLTYNNCYNDIFQAWDILYSKWQFYL